MFVFYLHIKRYSWVLIFQSLIEGETRYAGDVVFLTPGLNSCCKALMNVSRIPLNEPLHEKTYDLVKIHNLCFLLKNYFHALNDHYLKY